jgi:DNA-directed RNA polymerase subunit alpha
MDNKILIAQNVQILGKEKNSALIGIKGLYPGYGITLGNALRRVLLSSIPGAAITTLKIENVLHEFSTIPGVLEDVLDITLNLKQVRIKMLTSEPQEIYLNAKGEGEVKAGDIKVPSNLEIVNPELHIATLTDKKATLNIEMKVEKGIGFVSSEEIRKNSQESNAIFLDAIFSPIKKVNIEVEDMRVGEKTNYNFLKIYIETDGTIDPIEAYNMAIDILIEQFNGIKILNYE